MVDIKAWQPVHRWLVMHRKLVEMVFMATDWTLVVATVGAFFLVNADSTWWPFLTQVGLKAGTLSALAYLMTLVPGILKRFNQLPTIRVSAMLFRRQFGVLMFWLAIFHQAVVSLYPKLIFLHTWSLSLLALHEVYGLLAMVVLLPLWVTSNNISQKKLGKVWRWIHNLTYVALFFIYLHVATVDRKLTLIFLATIILEAISWVMYWLRPKSSVSQLV